MMFAMFGTLYCTLLVVGGGLIGLNHPLWGFIAVALGAVGMGWLTAAAKFAGFTHFVPAGTAHGMIMQDLLLFCRDDMSRVSNELYVTVPGSVPQRASGMFACRYNGHDVVVLESISNPQEATL